MPPVARPGHCRHGFRHEQHDDTVEPRGEPVDQQRRHDRASTDPEFKEAADRKLNAAYKHAMGMLSTGEQAQLRTEQRAWIACAPVSIARAAVGGVGYFREVFAPRVGGSRPIFRRCARKEWQLSLAASAMKYVSMPTGEARETGSPGRRPMHSRRPACYRWKTAADPAQTGGCMFGRTTTCA